MIIPATLKISFKNAEEIKKNEVYTDHYMINGNIVHIGTLLMKIIEKANSTGRLLTVSTTVFDFGYMFIKDFDSGEELKQCPTVFIPYEVVEEYGYVTNSMSIIDKLEIPTTPILTGCPTKTKKITHVNSSCN